MFSGTLHWFKLSTGCSSSHSSDSLLITNGGRRWIRLTCRQRCVAGWWESQKQDCFAPLLANQFWCQLFSLSHTRTVFLFIVETGGTHWPSSGGAPNLWSTKQSTHLWLARLCCDSQSRQVDPGWRHYFHWGKEFIPCAMIIFRGLSGAVAWLWHLDGWHSAGHLTGVCVCVCFFCVCASPITSTHWLDVRTPKSKGWKKKKDAEQEGDGEEVCVEHRWQEDVTTN